MILVVEGTGVPTSALRSALGDRPVRLAVDLDAARDWCTDHRPTLVILAGDAGSVSEFVGDVREGRLGDPTVPIVAVGPSDTVAAREDGIDAVLDVPVDGSALERLVDDAERLSGYRDAVDEFFDRAVARAEATDAGAPFADAEDVRSARERADRELESLRAHRGPIPYERLLYFASRRARRH